MEKTVYTKKGKGNRTGKGCYRVVGDRPLAKQPVAIRLPADIDAKLREHLSKTELGLWLRNAAIEKFEREQKS